VSTAAVEVLHDSTRRLRVRVPPVCDAFDLRVRLERLPGVERVRAVAAIRSVAVAYDGREATRTAVLQAIASEAAATAAAPAAPGQASVAPSGETGQVAQHDGVPGAGANARAFGRPWPQRLAGVRWSGAAVQLGVPAIGLAALPWLPLRGQQAVSVALVAARTLQGWAVRRDPAALAVEATSLAATALTGHPITAATSVLLGSMARVWRDRLVVDNERLLDHLTPTEAARYRVRRGRANLRLAPAAIQPADLVALAAGDVVPVDGFVHDGEGALAPEAHHDPGEPQPARTGDWVPAGRRLVSGSLRLSAVRAADASRAERLRRHVRHALASRDPAGGLTPDLHRLLALPVTTAGVVLALTRDAGRSAAMLQADPQEALTLAHPLAREVALYRLAREGLLMSGMDPIERLASCRAIALQDVGILTGDRWKVVEVQACAGPFREADARRLLGRLARGPEVAVRAGVHDAQVRGWHDHGAVIRWRDRPVQLAGAAVLSRAWGIELPPAPPRSGVARRLGLVSERGLEAVITLEVDVHPGAAAALARLRAGGIGRIAILTEDTSPVPPAALEALGADTVICASRRAQGDWLGAAARAGQHPALLHRGLRELLPPGGLSLCPVDAEAGAHGVMLGDPLASLLAGLDEARRVRRRLRTDFGAAVLVNAGLILASATRALPPMATAALHHAFAFALLRRNSVV
jgi:cation transport ATPase